jgi:hypothetical protein
LLWRLFAGTEQQTRGFAGIPSRRSALPRTLRLSARPRSRRFAIRGQASSIAPIVLLMFLGTLWLLYLQAFVIHSFCDYCLLSARDDVALTAIVVLLPAKRAA